MKNVLFAKTTLLTLSQTETVVVSKVSQRVEPRENGSGFIEFYDEP